MCELKTSNTEFVGSDGDDDRESIIKEPCNITGDSKGGNEDISFSSSPLSMKPMYAMTQWRHPQTRDGRLALFIVLPTGCIGREDAVKAELSTPDSSQLSFSWPPALLDADVIMRAILSFAEELRDGQGPLMVQGLRDYTDPLHAEAGEDVVPTCVIPLPFPVKPNFEEDLIKFDGSDTTTMYVLHFQAFERRFVTLKKRLTVRNIHFNEAEKKLATTQSVDSADTVSDSQNGKQVVISKVSS